MKVYVWRRGWSLVAFCWRRRWPGVGDVESGAGREADGRKQVQLWCKFAFLVFTFLFFADTLLTHCLSSVALLADLFVISIARFAWRNAKLRYLTIFWRHPSSWCCSWSSSVTRRTSHARSLARFIPTCQSSCAIITVSGVLAVTDSRLLLSVYLWIVLMLFLSSYCFLSILLLN